MNKFNETEIRFLERTLNRKKIHIIRCPCKYTGGVSYEIRDEGMFMNKFTYGMESLVKEKRINFTNEVYLVVKDKGLGRKMWKKYNEKQYLEQKITSKVKKVLNIKR